MEKVKADFLLDYLESLHSDAKCALDYNNDFELFIAIILSAQTTDKAVNKVTKELFLEFPTIKDLSLADKEKIETIIKQIGLYKNKTNNIINLSKKLIADGYDKIPNDPEYLITLPGVGRKTVNVFLSEYYNMNTFGVDTHIARISKRLNLALENDSTLNIEKKLVKYFSGFEFKRVHHLLIFFGRYDCKATNPNCENCLLKKYCKYYKNR